MFLCLFQILDYNLYNFSHIKWTLNKGIKGKNRYKNSKGVSVMQFPGSFRAGLWVLSVIIFGTISPWILNKLNFLPDSFAAEAKRSSMFSPSLTYANAVELAAPSVVSIKTTKRIPPEQNPLYQDPLFRELFGDLGGKAKDLTEIEQGLGSGVIVDKQGYILTNYHVIDSVDSFIITLPDGRKAEGTLIGSDPDTDISVVKIELKNLPAISIGDSKALRPGDVVLAIGNPFGLDKTVTHGIISAVNRSGTDIGILENLLQTDASINPGNSGGALVDTKGRLVGINTAIYSRSGGSQGIGFAIPIDQATIIMDQIIAGKIIERGYLGVELQSLSDEMREYINYKKESGVYVRAVVQNGPAAEAGIVPGDIIMKINNQDVKDGHEVFRMVAELKPGKTYPIEIFRKGKEMKMDVTIGQRKTKKQLY